MGSRHVASQAPFILVWVWVWKLGICRDSGGSDCKYRFSKNKARKVKKKKLTIKDAVSQAHPLLYAAMVIKMVVMVVMLVFVEAVEAIIEAK